MPPLAELTGTLRRERWRPPDAADGNSFVIAELGDASIFVGGSHQDLKPGTSVKGNIPSDLFILGMRYKFHGQWESEKRGHYAPAFEFTKVETVAPHDRSSVVAYLQKNAPGIGHKIATILYDCYGTDAVSKLRNDPRQAAFDCNLAVKRNVFSEEAARHAAIKLREFSLLEHTRIELAGLLNGRGFPHRLTEEVIRRWGPLAPIRIRRDPLSLMILDLPGCGFGRCDNLYCDLGLPPGRIKRQMLCLWRALKDDGNGHTWLPLSWAEKKLREKIAGAPVRLERAVKLGVRSGWLAEHVDERGQRWVAQAEAAEAERTVVESVAALSKWELPEACGTATPAEYAVWLGLHGRICFPGEYYDDSNSTGEVPAMTVGDKVRMGRETGTCQFCGRALVNPESMARGYGPICRERNNLP